MSVLKSNRSESKAEFINTANEIYTRTITFLTRLSARYSRLLAADVARLASEVVDNAEKANSIFPSDAVRRELRERHLLEARASLMDYKQFFPSASHAALYERHKRLLKHPNIREIADQIVRTIPGGYGLPLGVEVSQMEMVALPSPVDNFIKCQLHIKGASHYMDDYPILVPPDRDPKEILNRIVEKAAQYGLTVSIAKTRICPLSQPFKYCKAKFRLTETGRVVINGNRKSVSRARHKFKALKKKYDSGERTFEDVRASIQGSIAYFENYDDHNRVLKLRRLAYSLFGFKLDKRHNIIKEEDREQCDMWFTDDYAAPV